MTNPTGEAQNGILRPDFDRRIMLEFHGSVVTSDAGLLAYRELDDALGLNPSAGKLFADSRTGKNGRHALLGWKSSERLGRIAKSDGALRDELSGHWFDQVTKRRACKRVVLEQSVWNEHFGCTCYHPLFVFNQFGDMERCSLRPGNVHSADAWEAVLKPVVARYQGMAESIAFQGNAASCPAALQELSLQDKAASWPHPRRVAAKVEWHLGELFPRVGFIVTNLRYASKNVVGFYNKRGACEQWIKEAKGAISGSPAASCARLQSRDFPAYARDARCN